VNNEKRKKTRAVNEQEIDARALRTTEAKENDKSDFFPEALQSFANDCGCEPTLPTDRSEPVKASGRRDPAKGNSQINE
jgi:hypothetical protein